VFGAGETAQVGAGFCEGLRHGRQDQARARWRRHGPNDGGQAICTGKQVLSDDLNATESLVFAMNNNSSHVLPSARGRTLNLEACQLQTWEWTMICEPSDCLDPADWDALRAQGHRMMDDMFDFMERLGEDPVWRPIPASTRARFRAPLPTAPTTLESAHASFMSDVLPYAVGNAHPGFMGWVHGGGTAVGMLAEMLAAGLNANVGGRDQMPVEVERQITNWMANLLGFPATASGLFVTGTSMANLLAVLVARTRALGVGVRHSGIASAPLPLVAYTSKEAHQCVGQALDICGLGISALRRIRVDAERRMDVAALETAIDEDRRAGRIPFMVVATAGTVDTGAIDPLAEIAIVARRNALWFHVDGAYGALACLSDELRPLLTGISHADSIAFDFHKWGQVPYDSGFVLVRDGACHQEAFAAPAAYLGRESRGLAAGSPWPCDLGPDLSRGFRALKTWFTLKVYGTQQLGRVIAHTCVLARYLAQRVAETPELELMASVTLNIVCFRYRAEPARVDRLNRDIVLELHESGLAVPSTTRLQGALVIRCALVNHRTRQRDVDTLLEAVVRIGRNFGVQQ
jgi:aromatic-L-amino-acid decarboxylase